MIHCIHINIVFTTNWNQCLDLRKPNVFLIWHWVLKYCVHISLFISKTHTFISTRDKIANRCKNFHYLFICIALSHPLPLSLYFYLPFPPCFFFIRPASLHVVYYLLFMLYIMDLYKYIDFLLNVYILCFLFAMQFFFFLYSVWIDLFYVYFPYKFVVNVYVIFIFIHNKSWNFFRPALKYNSTCLFPFIILFSSAIDIKL